MALVIPAECARAHRLIVNCQVLRGQKVQVVSLYSDPFRSFPARGADVRVVRPDQQILARGTTDENGEFSFSYHNIEPLLVRVSQLDHEAEVTIPAQALKIESAGAANQDTTSGTKNGGQPDRTAPPVVSSANSSTREGIKDVLIGVSFLLALAAFVLSLRNARRLREMKNKGA
jgi:hypothetical protein